MLRKRRTLKFKSQSNCRSKRTSPWVLKTTCSCVSFIKTRNRAQKQALTSDTESVLNKQPAYQQPVHGAGKATRVNGCQNHLSNLGREWQHVPKDSVKHRNQKKTLTTLQRMRQPAHVAGFMSRFSWETTRGGLLERVPGWYKAAKSTNKFLL